VEVLSSYTIAPASGTPTTSPQPAAEATGMTPATAGAISAGVVAGVLLIALLFVAAVWYRRTPAAGPAQAVTATGLELPPLAAAAATTAAPVPVNAPFASPMASSTVMPTTSVGTPHAV
jgi:hypothetical protein